MIKDAIARNMRISNLLTKRRIKFTRTDTNMMERAHRIQLSLENNFQQKRVATNLYRATNYHTNTLTTIFNCCNYYYPSK